MNISIELKGTTPLLMHNPRMVDPEFDLNRQIKALTVKKKKTDEDLRQIEKLEWYGGLYAKENGDGRSRVVQPTSKVRKCLINAARISKMGKAVERALTFFELDTPLIYDGPEDIDQLFADAKYHSRLSVGLRGSRVMRVRPKFLPWIIRVDALFVEDAGLNYDDLQRIVELAGIVEGIGDARAIGYGRFIGKVGKAK